MAGASVTLTHNAPQIQAALTRLLGATRDLSAPFRDIGEYLLRSTDERFRKEQGPDGRRWPENSVFLTPVGLDRAASWADALLAQTLRQLPGNAD
jgi:hypothetical protein